MINRDEIARTLSFFRSVIKSGEDWTSACQEAYDNALEEPTFQSAEALAAWLESLHAMTPDGLICDNKWEPAQIAAKAVRGFLESAEPVGVWVSFEDRWPPESAAPDDPDIRTTDTVLVTNNINARDRMGRMSHVWLATPIKSTDPDTYGEVVAFDDGDRKICGLTHWLDPFAARQPAKAQVPEDTIKCLAEYLNEINKVEDGDRDERLEHHLDTALQSLTAAPNPPQEDSSDE